MNFLLFCLFFINYFIRSYAQVSECNTSDTDIILNNDIFSDPVQLVITLFDTCLASNEPPACFVSELESVGLSPGCSNCWNDFLVAVSTECVEEDECTEENKETCQECIRKKGLLELHLESCTGVNIFTDQDVDTCVDAVFYQVVHIQNIEFDMLNALGACPIPEEDSENFDQKRCMKEKLINLRFGINDEDCASCIVEHALCVRDTSCFEGCPFGDCEECIASTPCADQFNACSGIVFYNREGTCLESDRELILSNELLNNPFKTVFEFGGCDPLACLEEQLVDLGLTAFCAECWSELDNFRSICGVECHNRETRDLEECEDCFKQERSSTVSSFETCVGINLIPDTEQGACAFDVDFQRNSFGNRLEELPLNLAGVIRFCENGETRFEYSDLENCLGFNVAFRLEITLSDCIDCALEHALCLFDTCLSECDDSLIECVECLEATPCAAEFNNCSGIEYYFRRGSVFCTEDDQQFLLANPEFLDPFKLLLNIVECPDLDPFCLDSEIIRAVDISFRCSECYRDFREAVAPCSEICRDTTLETEDFCLSCIDRVRSQGEKAKFETCTGINLFSADPENGCSNLDKNLPLQTQGSMATECNPSFPDNQDDLSFDVEACLKLSFISLMRVGCATCVSQHGVCVDRACSEECSSNNLEECTNCVTSTECAALFNNCTGIEFYSLEAEESGESSENNSFIPILVGLIVLFAVVVVVAGLLLKNHSRKTEPQSHNNPDVNAKLVTEG